MINNIVRDAMIGLVHKDGLLRVSLERIIPENKKARKINIK